MWQKLASTILRYRLFILIGLMGLTAFMAFQATKVELQYEFGKLLPTTDSTNVEYIDFRAKYGQDGLVLVIATEQDDFYQLDKFKKWQELGNRIDTISVKGKGKDKGKVLYPIDSVFSEANIYNIQKNKELKKFELVPLVRNIETQKDLDSLKEVIHSLPFYRNIIYKESSDLHLMMVFLNEDVFNSKSRGNLVQKIENLCMEYEDDLGPMRFSGLPYVRASTMSKVKSELGMFVLLAILVSAIILFLFYRSINVVLVSLFVVSIGVVWSLGTIGLLGFKITILMGLMPPLMIVIGIPNCVYLITKYQQEYLHHGNKARALTKVIRKVGNATFLTNVTTALGFATFLLTASDMMRHFGLVAAINIIALFVISILVVPSVYSYLKPPKAKHTKHLDKKWLDWAINGLVNLSHHYRKWVYAVSVIVIALGIYGISLMKTSGNIVDDLPKGDRVVQDLKYFESELNGVMPFEVLVSSEDTIYRSYRNLVVIDSIQSILKTEDKLSRSISMIDGLKYISQAYSNGDEDKYVLRSPSGLQKIMSSKYFKNTFDLDGLQNDVETAEKTNQMLSGFLDSSHTEMRVTVQVKDIGIDSMNTLLSRLKYKLDNVIYAEEYFLDSIYKLDYEARDQAFVKLFNQYDWLLSAVQQRLMAKDATIGYENFETTESMIPYTREPSFDAMINGIIEENELNYSLTGSAIIYTKGTTYLVDNLITSLLAAVCVIAILMSFLFKSWRMVLVSLIPNILPLVFTSGLMGYLGVPIKPSTILVFSIAFGISVDDTIHFLAKYRQELKQQSWNIKGSVIKAIKETGVSMIYTSIILFFGFSIFIASNFGGTQALGILVSVTLFIAMLSNLVLLPSLLLTLERIVTTRAFKDPYIEVLEDEEEIELNELKLNDKDE